MREKNEKLLIILLVIGLVVFIGESHLYSAYITPISIDEVEFQSSSNWWSGDTWVITALQYGMGQELIGSISAEDMQDKANSDVKPKQDLTLKLENPKQTCEWDIITESLLYNYHYYTWETYWPLCSEDKALEECSGIGKIYLGFGTEPGLSIPKNCICMWKSNYGWTGDLSDETIRTTTTLKAEIEDDTITANIDTEGKSEGWLENDYGEKYGYYKYLGDLLIDSCRSEKPSMDNYKPIYHNGEWSFIDKTTDTDSGKEYNEYAEDVSDFEDYYKDTIEDEEQDWTVEEFKDKIDAIQNDINNFDYKSMDGDIVGNTYKELLENPSTNPEYVIYLKANWLGIYQPVPDMKIENIECSEIDASTGKGVCKVKLKNYGESGEGTLSIETPYPFSGDRINVQMDEDETSTWSLDISAWGNNEITKNADVCIQNSGGDKYCKTTTLTFNPQKLCPEEGWKQCRDKDTIDICNDIYSGFEFYKNCPGNKVCEDNGLGDARCKQGDVNPYCGDGFCSSGENCKNCFQDCACSNGYECKNGRCVKSGWFDFDINTIVLIIISILGIGTLALIAIKVFKK